MFKLMQIMIEILKRKNIGRKKQHCKTDSLEIVA